MNGAVLPPSQLLGLRQPSPRVYRLCDRAKGSLPRDFANMCLPGLLLPVCLSLKQATTDPHLCRRPSNSQRLVSVFWGVTAPFPGVLLCIRFCLCPSGVSISFQACESSVIISWRIFVSVKVEVVSMDCFQGFGW